MALDDLKSLDDGQLENLISDARSILEERKKAHRQEAIEAAREALAAVGLTLRDAAREPAAKKGHRPKTGAVPGKVYTNPDNKEQTWTAGRGRPPKWVAGLVERDQTGEGRGRR